VEGKLSKNMMMLLIGGVITGPLGARANPIMEGWINLYTEHRLAGSTTARMESRNVTDSADVTYKDEGGL
jgi:hypothetical protein